jgi:hypothetical protein
MTNLPPKIFSKESDNQQYKKDYQLNHVVLSEIWYFDLESKRYVSATLELFGHSFERRIFDKGKLKSVTRGLSSPNAELEYTIIETDGVTVTLESDAGTYRLSLLDFKRLKAHYDQMNVVFIQRREDFKNQITDLAQNLRELTESYQLALNFLRETPSAFFLLPNFIIGIECVIERRGNIGRSLLLSDEMQRSRMSKFEQKTKETSPGNTSTTTILHIENEAAINSYLNDSFFLFVKVIKDRLKLTTDAQAIYITYIFVYKIAIQYFAGKWADKYQENYFETISSMSLADALEIYCRIDTINPSNTETAGEFIYYLINNGKFETDNYLLCFNVFVQQLNPILEKQKLERFTHKLNRSPTNRAYTINDVDLMNGLEFEHFLAVVFTKMGYETEVTKASGDQGIDLIASKGGIKLGVQAKCYSGSVGNSAIQEAVAGINFYHLDKAIVITNSTFTDSAIKLANSNEVVLWDRNILKEKLSELF